MTCGTSRAQKTAASAAAPTWCGFSFLKVDRVLGDRMGWPQVGSPLMIVDQGGNGQHRLDQLQPLDVRKTGNALG